MSSASPDRKKTQARVSPCFAIASLRLSGHWIDRADNRNIEPACFAAWLRSRARPITLISRVIYELEKLAGDTSKSLYDRTAQSTRCYVRREGRPRSAMHVTIWLIDWKHPENNHFAIA